MTTPPLEQDLAARLARIERHGAIADVIYTYAEGVRRGDFAVCAALFAPDGVFDMGFGWPRAGAERRPSNRLEGPDAVLAYLNQTAAQGVMICPVIYNIRVDAHGDPVQEDEAASNCVMTATVLGAGTTMMGEYHDRFRRIDGRWRFTLRRYTMFRDGNGG